MHEPVRMSGSHIYGQTDKDRTLPDGQGNTRMTCKDRRNGQTDSGFWLDRYERVLSQETLRITYADE
jgi:hypothetical protein